MNAVTKGPDGATITVLDNEDRAVKRTVKTGLSDKNGIAIEEGLQPGERVVILSYSPVREGQKVRIGKPDAPSGRRP